MAGIALLKAHLAKSSYDEPLKTLKDVEAFLRRCYPTLEIEEVQLGTYEVNRWMIVCCVKYSEVVGANIGPVKPVRMVFSVDGTYLLEALLKSIGSGSWLASEPPHSRINSLLDTLLARSGYTLCPGIRSYEEEFAETIRFQSRT